MADKLRHTAAAFGNVGGMLSEFLANLPDIIQRRRMAKVQEEALRQQMSMAPQGMDLKRRGLDIKEQGLGIQRGQLGFNNKNLDFKREKMGSDIAKQEDSQTHAQQMAILGLQGQINPVTTLQALQGGQQ